MLGLGNVAPATWSGIKTKKALKEAFKKGKLVEFETTNGQTTTAHELSTRCAISRFNVVGPGHHDRKWYATVTKRNGKWVVT